MPFGSYLFGAIRRLLDAQNLPLFLAAPQLGYFMNMLPYLFVIVLMLISAEICGAVSALLPPGAGLRTRRAWRVIEPLVNLCYHHHVAYTWLALSVAQEAFGVAPEADYRMIALAAMGPDLVDKPLATIYFYRRYKSAVLFAHTMLASLLVFWVTVMRIPRIWVYS